MLIMVAAGAILLTCTTVLDVARRWSKKSQKGQQLPSPPGWLFNCLREMILEILLTVLS